MKKKRDIKARGPRPAKGERPPSTGNEDLFDYLNTGEPSSADGGEAEAAAEESTEEPTEEPTKNGYGKKLKLKLKTTPEPEVEAEPEIYTIPDKKRVRLGPEYKHTKAQKVDLERWKSNDRRALYSAYMKGHVADVHKQVGGGQGGVFLGSETDNLVVTIPVPAFPFEFLIRQDGLPLGIVMQLVAKWGTGKSGFVAEMFRWFDAAGGGGDYIDNETKFSPGWFRSFMGKEAYDCLAVAKSYTIDEWQDKLTAIIDDHKRRMTGSKKLPGPGRCIPTMFAIDSVMGKLKDETVEKIKSEGHGGKGYPVEALAITRYMQVASSWLDGWPFVMVLVNHLKEKNDDRGNAIRSTAGGKHLNFQETFELELARFGSRIDTETFEGFHVQIECMKNSLGGGSRRIQTRVIWWYEEDPLTGQLVQQSRWDWDWTTVKLLNGLLNGQKSSPLLRSRLKKIGFHLEVGKSGDAENSAWSKNLKMHSSGQATWNEVGAMIAQDERLTDRLRKALLIHRQPVLAGDYLAQRNELAGKAS